MSHPGKHLSGFQQRLSCGRAPILMALLGISTGLLSALIITAFRVLYEVGQRWILDGGNENYEALSGAERLALSVTGALFIGLYLRWVARFDTRMGIAYVIERTAYHQGLLPVRNAIHQFVTGVIAIVSGQSVGREGPGVHLGASAGSQLGQRLGLPHNTLRVLVACGTAAAIAASFNTPLAGVAFAMEVVVMEYTIAGFLPVIMAAVTAATLTQIILGAHGALLIPAVTWQGPQELPLVIGLGVVMGGLAALFIRTLHQVSRYTPNQPTVRYIVAAGLCVGIIALWVPQVMGIGYDTVADALNGRLGLGLLLGIALAKLAATIAALGLGMPGGLIGPTLVMGATAGGAVGRLAQHWMPTTSSASGVFALLGMGAMMAAVLRAPLAALTAMLELTGNPAIILPGMLVVAAAILSSRELFRTDSVYHMALGERGLDPRRNPLLQAASRLGIVQLINPRCIEINDRDRATAQGFPEGIDWQLFEHREGIPQRACHYDHPEQILTLATIDERASLREALERLAAQNADALIAVRKSTSQGTRWCGILTLNAIETAYLG